VISLDDLRSAQARVGPVIRATPVTTSGALSDLVGRRLSLKGEHLQRTGSYKIRGAYNRISRLDPDTPGGVVAASAGNHAQGVALAARLAGIRSTIFMPRTAPLPKVSATRGYGAEVRLVGQLVDDCILAALEHAAATGAVFVPPFDDPHVIAGQGTVGLELAEESADAEVVVVPVGGGGLIAGVATALALTRPAIRVVGVEAAGAAAVRASLDAGRCVVLERVATMADGIALRSPSELTLSHVQAYVDDVVTVTEEEISTAVLLLLERTKALVEPAGAVGLAALLAGKVAGTGPATTILSGGNVDPLLLLKLVDHGLSAAGRYLVVRVVLGDRPGALAALTAVLAALGLNVLSVEHHRAGLALGVDEVEVLLTLETRDPDHRHEIVAAIGDAGFAVDLVR
jgi:threonine dehydratase